MERDFTHQRVAILVDSSNLFMTALRKGVKIDHRRLLESLNHRQILRAILYHVEVDPEREAGFLRKVRSFGFEVRTKQLKVYSDGTRKGDMDVDITIDAVALADKVDAIVLVSGDGDYLPLVHYLKSRGVKVEAMSFECNMSRDLRESVDEFIPITEAMLLSPSPS